VVAKRALAVLTLLGDPETGRVVTSGLVPGFGTTGLAGRAGRLWTATAGGRASCAKGGLCPSNAQMAVRVAAICA
jgi:hypothetical protein